MRVLITGATGFIGTALSDALSARGDTPVPLRRGGHDPNPGWDIAAGRIDDDALDGVDAVVHLAGESILPPWTKAKKARIMRSRVDGTDLIARAVAKASTPTLLTASGMDFYGDRGEDLLTESEPPGDGFMSRVTQAWETAAAPAVAAGARVAHLRSSLVLDSSGGSLPKMMWPFRFFVGGRIGGGRQWWSWISLEDEIRAILHVLDTGGIRGPVNLASPNPVRNSEFMTALGAAMGRPSWFPTPRLLLEAVLGAGAANALLLESKRVVPEVLSQTGFGFTHPEIGPAMAAAVH
ncbi:MAG TPA: TIGR01777 family oxidoreductase [Acidimicrobiia bacterium]|nr:TIGR01777 family oxidoreductase [Acidimicrobiia bacterium]